MLEAGVIASLSGAAALSDEGRTLHAVTHFGADRRGRLAGTARGGLRRTLDGADGKDD